MKHTTTISKADSSFFTTFFKIKSEKDNIYWSGHESAPDISGLKEWYEKQSISQTRIIFKIECNQNPVGYLYFDICHKKSSIELSYAVSKEYSGRGIGSSAVREAVKYSLKNFFKYDVFTHVANSNIGSIKIMTKNQFSLTGASYNQTLNQTKEEVVMEQYKFVNNNVFIIAEAGVNHNGDIELAKKLIDVAVAAGVDAVKFQTWKTELLVTKDAKQAEYQTINTDKEESQFDMLKKLEISYDDFLILKKYCDKKRIMFLSTADEMESADFLNNIQDIFKIGSGELTNLPYLRHVGGFKKKIILSTGMCNLIEIKEALNVLVNAGTQKDNITILHANTQYPTPMGDVNLNAMLTIKKTFDIDIGYSDHTLGIEVPIAAVALGAKVIEKHFTLDKNMLGPDHKASLSPQELKNMVDSIRKIELAMGSSVKEPSISESPNIEIVRKSIVANCDIKKGDIFSELNLTAKRPGTGISPMNWDDIIGTLAEKDYIEGQLI